MKTLDFCADNDRLQKEIIYLFSKKVEGGLKEKLKLKDWEIENSLKGAVFSRHNGIYITRDRWMRGEFSVGLEAGMDRARSFFVGIRRNKEGRLLLENALWLPKTATPWGKWIWLDYLDGLKDWGDNPHLLLQMNKERCWLLESITNPLIEIYEIVDETIFCCLRPYISI